MLIFFILASVSSFPKTSINSYRPGETDLPVTAALKGWASFPRLISLFLQIYINQNIDFVLAIFLIISSSIGAAIASRIIDKFDQENLKVLFGVLLVIIASFLIYELFRTPIELFKINYV